MTSGNAKDFEIAKHDSPINGKEEKRYDYLEWDEYFMAMTFLERRKCSKGHLSDAAIVLNQRKIIISMANSCVDDNNETDNSYVTHVEYKALQKIQQGHQGHVMYTTLFPCEKCAEAIARAGIVDVVYYQNNQDMIKAKKLFEQYGVTYRQFTSKKKKIELDFNEFCDN